LAKYSLDYDEGPLPPIALPHPIRKVEFLPKP
jgi:hypothetical protein